MLRASSLAFTLRAGVKYHPSSTSPEPNLRYRTVQARIDSIIYERLRRAEHDLFSRLQTLIFRTAGCLNKDQIYPVALVLWQLLRFLGISASHLGNIVQRFQSKGKSARTQVKVQKFCGGPKILMHRRYECSIGTSILPTPRLPTSHLHAPRALPLL